jgi:hypothetical protein
MVNLKGYGIKRSRPISRYYLSMALQPFVEPWPLFQFLELFTRSVGLLGRGISSSQGLYLHTRQHKQNKRTQTSMPQVGFEPTIPVFERAKTVHALDPADTVIGISRSYPAIQLKELRRTAKNLNHCGWYRERDSSHVPPKYTSGMLPLEPIRPV